VFYNIACYIEIPVITDGHNNNQHKPVEDEETEENQEEHNTSKF